GRGVFASLALRKGDFVVEYRGDLISIDECHRRQNVYPDALKGFMYDFKWNGKYWCIDAAKEDDSLGRLVNDNHINPNCKVKRITVKGKPHLCLFAIRDISPGEEITYDYGSGDWPWRCKVIMIQFLKKTQVYHI
ncbi:KT5AA methyltransferase, partial [Polypterus senegalus]|nr:KT5AA methyltransferase [Polypterus senegalus]